MNSLNLFSQKVLKNLPLPFLAHVLLSREILNDNTISLKPIFSGIVPFFSADYEASIRAGERKSKGTGKF